MTQLARDINQSPIQAIYPGTCQTIAVAVAAAVLGTAVGANTTIIRIVSTTNCHYAVGTAAVCAAVTTSYTYLPAGVVEFVSIAPGQFIGFIRTTADGTAYVTEGA